MKPRKLVLIRRRELEVVVRRQRFVARTTPCTTYRVSTVIDRRGGVSRLTRTRDVLVDQVVRQPGRRRLKSPPAPTSAHAELLATLRQPLVDLIVVLRLSVAARQAGQTGRD